MNACDASCQLLNAQNAEVVQSWTNLCNSVAATWSDSPPVAIIAGFLTFSLVMLTLLPFTLLGIWFVRGAQRWLAAQG